MTCRANSGSLICGATPTGAIMAYSNERELAHWQNTPSSPTVQDDFLYDGSGARMEQSVNASGTITKYLGVPGLPSAVRVGSTLSYLVSDGLGSVSEAFDSNGNETAAQLYTPYGQVRYTSGVMPTSKGFTGQRADATTGLDYYGRGWPPTMRSARCSKPSVAKPDNPYVDNFASQLA